MRLVHLIGMWCFIIFAMIHVYLSILSGNVDRDGTKMCIRDSIKAE